jgi:hypothetical protein
LKPGLKEWVPGVVFASHFEQTGKRAFITDGSRGIGQAFAGAGTDAAVVARGEEGS